MQKIKYVLATAFFALAIAFIATPTVTFAGPGDETSGDVGYEYTSAGSDWYNDYSTSDYTSPGSTWYNDYSTYSSIPSYSYGCSNCGGSAGYSSTPSYSYGCSNCGSSSGSSIPSYTTSSSRSTSNPNSVNTNTNTTGPSTSTATGGSASSTNTNNLINNSPSTATATNNSTTTVNVVNNIVVNVPRGSGGTTPTTNDLSVNCTINPSNNVQINQDVNFYANASGGNGSYSYSWTGSDGLNSSSQSFTGRFYSSGSKYATVTVYSGGQSRTATCNTNVGGNNNGNLSAYCTATPPTANTNQYITWTVYPTGGNGNYSYSWSGSDGLYGNNSSLTQSYSSTGQKNANVTVTSNGQSITANCSANINSIFGYQTQASNVTLIKGTSDQIAPASGIYLGQLPETGINLSLKVVLFAFGLLVWSIFAAFVVSKRKKTTDSITGNAIADFKTRMLAMKNQ